MTIVGLVLLVLASGMYMLYLFHANVHQRQIISTFISITYEAFFDFLFSFW